MLAVNFTYRFYYHLTISSKKEMLKAQKQHIVCEC